MLGVLTYTGARVGALARLRRGDLQDQETQRVKQREIPVRHDLDEWIAAYLEAGGIFDAIARCETDAAPPSPGHRARPFVPPVRVIFPKSYSENHLCFYAVLLFRKGCRRQAGHPLPPCTVLVSTLYAFLPSVSHSLREVYELAQSDFW